MPRRSRDNLGIFFPNTPTPSDNQPSLFFGGYHLPSLTVGELEDPLGEQFEIFEEPIGKDEEENIPHMKNMVENRNEGDFPIRETNGDSRMKYISPSALPHFYGLTSEVPDNFLFEFVFICRTYDYTSDDYKLKLFQSTLKDATLCWFMGLPRDIIATWAHMQQSFNNKYRGLL